MWAASGALVTPVDGRGGVEDARVDAAARSGMGNGGTDANVTCLFTDLLGHRWEPRRDDAGQPARSSARR